MTDDDSYYTVELLRSHCPQRAADIDTLTPTQQRELVREPRIRKALSRLIEAEAVERFRKGIRDDAGRGRSLTGPVPCYQEPAGTGPDGRHVEAFANQGHAVVPGLERYGDGRKRYVDLHYLDRSGMEQMFAREDHLAALGLPPTEWAELAERLDWPEATTEVLVSDAEQECRAATGALEAKVTAHIQRVMSTDTVAAANRRLPGFTTPPVRGEGKPDRTGHRQPGHPSRHPQPGRLTPDTGRPGLVR
ncbi:hypothetical protein ABT336_17410 [Micromonospora sp. NPDC000207]|uniref:hypothetical protein n=1 Tax=Micromonospora sp. NPDC000207 TaxID=3154246 RepID=UPI00333247B0